MPYALLGNACHAPASAFVSNHKYLPPLDPVYFKTYTQMNRYPGQSSFSTIRGKGRFTEQIKTFYGKNSNPIMHTDRNTVSDINPPTRNEKLLPIHKKHSPNNTSSVKESTTKENGKCTSCSVEGDNDNNLYPILDPMFNLREVAKHLILL